MWHRERKGMQGSESEKTDTSCQDSSMRASCCFSSESMVGEMNLQYVF